MGFDGIYPLVMTNIAMENGPFVGDLPLQVVIFHSYVTLPDSIYSSVSWDRPLEL